MAALPHPTGAACLAFLPDTRLLTGTVDGGMFLWELSAGQLLGRLPGHQAEVTCISLSPGQACSVQLSQIFLSVDQSGAGRLRKIFL